ncbi:S8 family serine peptidase [Streptomyces sp. CO7]
MRRTIWSVVVAVSAMTLGAAPAHAAPPMSETQAAHQASKVDPRVREQAADGETVRVNVVTRTRADLPDAAEAGEVVRELDRLPVVTMRVNAADLADLAAQPGVASVTEDRPEAPTLAQSVPLVGGDKTRAAALTGAGSVVAVLDTGVATHHPFLAGRIAGEACFSVTDPDYEALSLCPDGSDEQQGTGSADAESGPCAHLDCSHGTHVAGIAAGNGKNVAGAPPAGVAPRADVLALQVFSEIGSEDFCGEGAAPCVLSFPSAQLAALEDVLAKRQSGMPVIAANMSLGSGQYTAACDSDLRKPAIDALLAAGVATVVSAGNSAYASAVSAPACISSAIAVGSTTKQDDLSYFSNRGPQVDLFAPGSDITSSVPGNGWGTMSGTSMAAPHVTGAFAVLHHAYPAKSATELAALLKSTGKPLTVSGVTTPRIQLDTAVPATPPAQGTDFDGDGAQDTVIGDPEATVSGNTDAGVVRVIYGGGKGTATLHQDLSTVPGSAQPGDRFGEVLTTFDHNKDGYTDLVVGVPAEDIDTETDAGWANIIYGAPGGLTTGTAPLVLMQGTGEGGIRASAPEAGDRFGQALAAGSTAQGEPYLVLGVPGEDLDTLVDAGVAHYLRGTTNLTIHQDTPGMAGDAEAGDMFGSSVAGSANHVVVGAPGEAVGTMAGTGNLQVLAHTLNAENVPTPIVGLTQGNGVVSGAAEAGDEFGAALAAVAYAPEGTTAPTDTIFAVGAPGEALAAGTVNVTQAGTVQTFRVTAAGTVTQAASINAQVANVDGELEVGDRFGQSLAITNLSPKATGSAQTLVLAVGIPGKDIGTHVDAGAVQTFYPFGTPGDSDRWIQAGDASGLGGTPTAGDAVGSHLSATATHLNIGVPSTAPHGAAYSLPWNNATGGRTGTLTAPTSYVPGQKGLPAEGGAFGWAIS